MDVKREGVAKKKMIRRVLYLVLLAAVVAVAGWRVSLLKPAVPVVEAATIWPDTVKRGPMVREVRGLGTLVPEDILWFQAEFDSQVSRILARSGDDVKPNTVLLVLTNPQMEADAVDYEWQTKQAEANLVDLRVKLQSQTFDQQSAVSTAQGELKQADINRDKEEQLFKAQLEPEINMRLAVAKWEQADARFKMEKQKLDIFKESVQAQIDSQKVQVEKLRATYKLKKRQLDELTIRAGIRGRMQEMTLQVGQRVKPGDVLAKVAQPRKLMARLQIPETQAKDIVLGQQAQIDTRNGIVRAHVIRIDASIVNGTRTVDCKLDGALAERRGAGSERRRNHRDRAPRRRAVCWPSGVRAARQPRYLVQDRCRWQRRRARARALRTRLRERHRNRRRSESRRPRHPVRHGGPGTNLARALELKRTSCPNH